MSGVKRGFSFKTSKGEKAPDAFKALPPQEDLSVKPSRLTTGVKAMFSTGKSTKSARSVHKPDVTKPAVTKPAVTKPAVTKSAVTKSAITKPLAVKPIEVIEEEQEAEPESDEDNLADMISRMEFTEKEEAEPGQTQKEDLREMADLIAAEESKTLYGTDVPNAYVPETRRGFSEFIKQTYSPFELPEVPIDIQEGDKYYPYQKFVRDYMRKESPYRGVLVYHGLGSGKTCTSIATAEALFASAKKKIIVMTPKALKKNFMSEVSFCGFRHFQLQNFWVKLDPTDPTVTLFANQVLGLSGTYLKKARSVWAPDFRKAKEEANYNSLPDEDRNEIRVQITSILEWDPKTNPTGRIRFIRYNGISAKTLQEMACSDDKFFDDSVIVIDEIHNMIRLMHGTIDPYLIKLKGFKRLIAPEDVSVGRWKPTLCNQSTRRYARGYMFYRLLMDARNSKIVGLSGTPLINFPEELGILANVLHGYMNSVNGLVEQVGQEAQAKAVAIGRKHPFTDFVGVKQDPGGGTRVTITLLPYGIRKLEDKGVERIPPEEVSPTPEDVIESIREAYAVAGMPFKKEMDTDMSKRLVAKPILPPFGDAFAQAFINGDGSGLKNKSVLVTRLTGLISYYKGSRLDLMPRIKVDEIVRVPFSLFSQRAYSIKRGEEAERELEKGDSAGFGGTWAQVYEVNEKTTSSNYKMGSRQACNFSFPSEVARPSRSDAEALKEASAAEGKNELVTVDDMDESVDPEAVVFGEEPEEEEEIVDEFPLLEREEGVLTGGDPSGSESFAENVLDTLGNTSLGRLIPTAAPEVAAVTVDAMDEVAQGPAQGPAQGSAQGPAQGPAEEAEEEASKAPSFSAIAIKPSKVSKTLQTIRGEMLAACKSGRKPGEPYEVAMTRAIQCLRGILKDRLKLGGPNGLETYSPKFAEMLKRIGEIPGSSLVYSNFLEAEGIGIFRICMEVNGYFPIEIVSGASGPMFSKATALSFTDPAKRGSPRYISFTGGVKDDVRRLALNIFNAKFSELPESMNAILTGAGFMDNMRGQLCKVFCITAAGAEGLSLKNVRAVHIMEPYWNEVRLKQVKGRAIRIGSHLELAEADRDVSIFTYISVFSDEAQLAKRGDMMIDETIRNIDRVDRRDAVKMGLPIPAVATEYILTSDERLYVISQKKKGIIDALESVMKSAAIDCELNYKQNKDGTFKCLPLKGSVGDFLYTPDFDEDIAESAKYTLGESVSDIPVPKVSFQKYQGTIYRMRQILDATGAVTGFEMFDKDDAVFSKRLGTAGASGGKPGKPIVMTNE